MPKIKDLVGQTFNKLTVVEYVGQNKDKRSLWKSMCICGNEKITTRTVLVKNQVKSCGLCGEKSSVSKDLQGKVFGRLTVIGEGKIKTEVLVRCECGKEKYISKVALNRGDAKSCGCQLYQNRVNLSGKTFNDLHVVEKLEAKYGNNRLYRCTCKCGEELLVTGDDLQRNRIRSCENCYHNPLAHDLSDLQFGALVVIDKHDNLSSNKTSWLCRCTLCGTEKPIKTANLLNGHAKSCGCQINYNRVDHTGKAFGRLTVLEPFDVQGTYWWYLCQCSCGNEHLVSGSNLQSGKTKSCGCLQKELAGKRLAALKGPLNPNWRGGSTEENYPRNTREYKEWRNGVLQKDNYCCQLCTSQDNLHAHHLYSFVDNPDKRTDINFGTCLCQDCHRWFHAENGRGNNTPEQFYQWRDDLIGVTPKPA